jgi:serine/threonine-protein kinase
VLGWQGRFTDSLAELKRGHELGSRQPGWPYPSAQWIREAERAPKLDAQLAQVLSGQAQPTDGAERLELARFCVQYKQLPVAAARLCAEAFSAQLSLADDLQQQHRYNAACAAALAGCGRGKDAANLIEEERARWRRQALTWLRADLTAWGRQFDQDADQARPGVVKAMQGWQADPDFAGVRGPEALGALPESERQEWQTLWEDVAALLRRAQAPEAPSGPRSDR